MKISKDLCELINRNDWQCEKRQLENHTLNYGGAVEYDYQVQKKICRTLIENEEKKSHEVKIELGLLNLQDFFFVETQYPVLLEITDDL